MANIEQYFTPGASLLRAADETNEAWRDLVTLSQLLKDAARRGEEKQYLRGKSIALIFEKTSTRTRAAFEVAATQQGAHTTYLAPSVSQAGHKESIEDTARVLGRMYDGIGYRGSRQKTVKTLNRNAGVPIWNGLTDKWHPTQALADSLTMLEHSGKPFDQISYAFIGDGRSNMANSLLVSGAMLGTDVRIVSPKSLRPDKKVREIAKKRAKQTGAKISITKKVDALEGVDFVYTDVWVSMGEPMDAWQERIDQLLPYRVDEDLMDVAGDQAKFMHCLPSLHDLKTTTGRRINERFGLAGVEVSDEVFQSDRSIVFDQAENRLHTVKAVMVRALGSN